MSFSNIEASNISTHFPIALPEMQPRLIEDYNDELSRICGGLEVQAEGGNRCITGSISRRRLALFDGVIVSLDASRVLRDQETIHRFPGEYLFLMLQVAGCSHVVQDAETTTLQAGDIFVVDSLFPSEFIYDGQASCQMSIHLPRDESIRRLGQVCTGGFGIDRMDPLHGALHGVIGKMLNNCSGNAALSEALFNILSAYCWTMRTGREDRADRIYQKALEAIASRATEPDFSIDDLAEELSVSRRSLQRAFTRRQDSVRDRLRTVRLDLAYSRLRACNALDQGGIASVASGCGFNDLSHFYHVFRERFGMPPGSVRYE